MGTTQFGVCGHGVTVLLCWLILINVCSSGTALVNGRFPAHKPMQTTYACENSKLRIKCSDGQVIRIMRANYGRFSVSVCNRFGITEGWNLQCMSFRSLKIVSERCDGRQSCEMMANNFEFGDPCPDTSKYAEVKYFCQNEELTASPSIESTTTITTTAVSSSSISTSTISTTPASLTTNTYIHTIPPTVWFKISPTPRKNHYPNTATSIQNTISSINYEGRTTNRPEATHSKTTRKQKKTTLKPRKTTLKLRQTTPRSRTTTPKPRTTTPKPRKTTPKPRKITPKPRKITPALTTKSPELAHYMLRSCAGTIVDGIWWPVTAVGNWAQRRCPNKLKGNARWLCSTKGWRGSPDLSNCVSPWVEQLDKKIDDQLRGDVSGGNAMEILENLTDITSVNTGDLKRTTTKLLPKLIQVLQKDMAQPMPPNVKREKVKRFSKSFLKTSSNLLAKKQKTSWQDLHSADRIQAAMSLLINVETSAYSIASTVEIGMTDTIINDNIMVEVSVMKPDKDLQDITFPSPKIWAASRWAQSSDTITIPKESLSSNVNNGVVQVVFTVYNNINQYMNPYPPTETQTKERDITEVQRLDTQSDQSEENTNVISQDPNDLNKRTVVNTNIISASINGHQQQQLKEPVEFTLEHLTTEKISNPVCSFWDMDKNTMKGRWSSDQCQLTKTNSTHTMCKCNHLTNFAVLMDITGSKLSPRHQQSLRVITYVGCIISIICLLLSWITFISFKNLQCDRLTIHKHLVFSLMLAEIIFLAGIGQTENQIFCSIIAGLLHFLFMVAFAWMCLEGIQLYVMLIEVFEKARSRIIWYYSFGYGIPTVIVLVSASVYHQGYGSEIHCWLSTKRNFIWSFVGPAVAVITVNVIMLSIAIYMMCKHANSTTTMKEKTKFQKFRAWIKGAVVLVVLLGLTWAVGLLFLNEETVAMAYMFTILNSLQGLFIFIFHCLMNEKVQKEYRKFARRSTWLPLCIRVNYGGYTGNLCSSPNQSSGSAHGYFSKLFTGRRRKRSMCTNSSTKPFLSHRGAQDSRSTVEHSGSRDSNSYPSTINGYIYNGNNNDIPKSLGVVSNGVVPLETCFEQVGGIAGDLSEAFDCSIIDSEVVTEYCHNNMQVSHETRCYSSGSEDCQQTSDEEKYHDQLSTLSYDSIVKNRDSFISNELDSPQSDLDDDDLKQAKCPSGLEKAPLVSDSDSKQNLVNSLLSMLRKRKSVKLLNGKIHSPSLSNINGIDEKKSEEKLNVSTPNLKFKGGVKCSELKSHKSNGIVMQLSLPNISTMEKDFETENKAKSFVQRGFTIKRLKSDMTIQMDPHRFDLSSSKC